MSAERSVVLRGRSLRAVLDGTKTQARFLATMTLCGGKKHLAPAGEHDDVDAEWVAKVCGPCPYGVARDRLWVRESVHMPRALSRIDLLVTAVRVERLQSITEDDARAEGVNWQGRGHGETWPAVAAFSELWGSINSARAGASWAANPWVWVVSFDRVRP